MNDFVTRVPDGPYLGHLSSQLQGFAFDPREVATIRGLGEQLERVIRARDSIGALRASMIRQDVPWGGEQPSEREQEGLFSATYRYFDRAYVALSHMHSVVSRFSTVFNVRPSVENRALLEWMAGASPSLSHEEIAELERARLFRAMLVHSDQFAPYGWLAHSNSRFELVHIALYGHDDEPGRPDGSMRMPPAYRGRGDWLFEAPDEIATTNAVFSGALDILSRIAARRTPGAAFRDPSKVLDEARRKLQPPDWGRKYSRLSS